MEFKGGNKAIRDRTDDGRDIHLFRYARKAYVEYVGQFVCKGSHDRRDGGPDHPAWVIALCPKCHRRAHYGADGPEYNRTLTNRANDWNGVLRRLLREWYGRLHAFLGVCIYPVAIPRIQVTIFSEIRPTEKDMTTTTPGFENPSRSRM
jgi:hypothetical protein